MSLNLMQNFRDSKYLFFMATNNFLSVAVFFSAFFIYGCSSGSLKPLNKSCINDDDCGSGLKCLSIQGESNKCYKDNHSLVSSAQTSMDLKSKNQPSAPQDLNTKKHITPIVQKYPNGQIKSEAFFISDEKDGIIKNWYENGGLRSEIRFVDGKKQGLAQFWHSNGEKNIEILFDKDLISSCSYNGYRVAEDICHEIYYDAISNDQPECNTRECLSSKRQNTKKQKSPKKLKNKTTISSINQSQDPPTPQVPLTPRKEDVKEFSPFDF